MSVADSVGGRRALEGFMHLRQERAGLLLTVIIGLFVMALVLFLLIAPDALRIREMATPGSGLGARGSGLDR